jgi:hypothetical protein
VANVEKIIKQLSPTDFKIKSIDEQTRTIWHRISREVTDLMGDIVRIAGGDFTTFLKKPSVLYGHNYSGMNPIPVIAKNVGFKIEGDSLYAATRFLDIGTPGMSQAMRDLINDNWILHKQKLMGWSIGFFPSEVDEIKDTRGQRTGYDYIKWLLLEYSSVIIPANQEAINDQLRKGILSKSFLDSFPQNFPLFYYREISPAEVSGQIRYAALRLLEFTRDRMVPRGTKLRPWALSVGIQWVKETHRGDPRAKIHDKPMLGFVDFGERSVIFIRADVPFRKIERAIPHEFSHLLFNMNHPQPVTEEEEERYELVAEGRVDQILSDLYGDKEYMRMINTLI